MGVPLHPDRNVVATVDFGAPAQARELIFEYQYIPGAVTWEQAFLPSPLNPATLLKEADFWSYAQLGAQAPMMTMAVHFGRNVVLFLDRTSPHRPTATTQHMVFSRKWPLTPCWRCPHGRNPQLGRNH